MSKKNFPLRCVMFVIGMITAACGIALVTNANLGTTPITTIPLALNAVIPLSVGAYVAMFNGLLVALQKVVLGPDFKYSSLFQLPPVFIFGMAVDVWLHLTSALSALPYFWRLLVLMAGIVVMSAGILIQVRSNVTVLPGDGIVIAMTLRTHHSFGSIKVITDCSMVAAAFVIDMVFVGAIVGIREGTLLSAVLTGFVMRAIGWCLNKAGFDKEDC